MKSWNDKCAVFGIWKDPEASWMTYLGLYAQQHRGQESAGIVSFNEEKRCTHRGVGLVGEVFNESALQKLKGLSAIGHTRYSTQGKDQKKNIQPLSAEFFNEKLSIAHNGNIVNFPVLKKELAKKGCVFHGTSDTECIIHLLAGDLSSDSLVDKLKKCLVRVEGAYSLVLLTKSSLVAVRDPRGFRPLVLGERSLKNGEKSWVVASETCAFDLIGAKLVREIEPGEIWKVDKQGENSVFLEKSVKNNLSRCVFEHVYFARPDSQVFSRSVYQSRKKMGQILAKETPVPADIVIPVPDSGIASALGYSEASGIAFEMGIIRNHYIGRTFIHPSQSIRDFRVKIKLNPQKNLIAGKKVIVVDDSIVRGTTSQAVVRLLKKAGAKEVHFRVSSPPITGPCFYGVDTPNKEELIASQMSVREMQSYLGADSLAFLSPEGLMNAVQTHSVKPVALKENGFCSACFTGKYPTRTDYK